MADVFRARPKKNSSILRMKEEMASDLKRAFSALVPKTSTDAVRSGVMGYICNAAQCAFGAYRDPRVDGLEEHTLKQNTIKHLNWDLLNDTMEGVLKIQLKNCKNLRDADWFGSKSDPYVVFMTGESLVRSTTRYDDLNPEWDCDECHYLFVRQRHLDEESGRYLTVSVFDKDSFRKSGKFDHIRKRETCLGTARLDMRSLKKPGVQTFDAKLSHGLKGRPAPTIRFDVEFIPVEQALNEMDKDITSDAWLDQTDHLEHEIRWPELANMTDSGCVEVEPVAFIDASTTGSQAWIHVNRDANVVVVAFRGTEVGQLKDIFTDLKFLPGRLTATMRSTKYQMKPTEALLDKKILLHSGFRDAYESIRDAVLRIVYDITGWDSKWTVCTTGHSLGGALATICSFELTHRELLVGETAHQRVSLKSLLHPFNQRNQMPKLRVKPKVAMISFGAPKVGLAVFAKIYNATVPTSLRVNNEDDPVTRIPPFYTHTDGEIVVQSTGDMDLDGKSFHKSSKPRKSTQSAKPTIRSRGLDSVTETSVVEVHDSATESDGSSSGGSGRLNVVSHLQPRYYENIKAAVSNFFFEDMKNRGRPLRILRASELRNRLSKVFTFARNDSKKV